MARVERHVHPPAQERGRRAGARDEQDLLGRDALRDEGGEPADQRLGAAGAGGARDQERAGAVADRPSLRVTLSAPSGKR